MGTKTAAVSFAMAAQPAAEQAQAWSWLEKRLMVGVMAVVLLFASLPYIYGYLSAPADKQYMGILLDVPDHAQYFSWMRELTTQNLISNKMTPEANQPLFFNLLWWGLGRLGALLGANYAVMFQALRVSATLLFFWLVYRLLRWLVAEPRERMLAFLLVAFSSGFGWVLVLIKSVGGGELPLPLTVYVAEGNTFLSMMGYPHFIAALLYILVFELVLRGQARGQLRYAVWAGLFALFLGWQHAYDLVSIYAVLLAYAGLSLLRERRLPWYLIWSGLIIGLISVWPALYSVWLTASDPLWKEILKQFANAGVYTPNPLQLVILFGVIFLLALYTLVRDNPLRLQRYDNRQLFVLGWFVVTFGLIYLPVDYQIHLLNGWQVPMAILAAGGFYRYLLPALERLASRLGAARQVQSGAAQRWLAAGLVLAVLPTTLYLWSWRFVDLARHTYPYYLEKNELAALDWLDQHAGPDEVIFSSLTIGQYVPMLTGSHAFLAHWAQTADFFGKSQAVADFYGGKLDPTGQAALLKKWQVKYVFDGPAEAGLGAARLDQAQFLKAVYQNAGVTVYEVAR